MAVDVDAAVAEDTQVGDDFWDDLVVDNGDDDDSDVDGAFDATRDDGDEDASGVGATAGTRAAGSPIAHNEFVVTGGEAEYKGVEGGAEAVGGSDAQPVDDATEAGAVTAEAVEQAQDAEEATVSLEQHVADVVQAEVGPWQHAVAVAACVRQER